MKLKSWPATLVALLLLLLAVLACRQTAKQPDWTKSKKIAGREQNLAHISGFVLDEKFGYVTIGGTVADQQAGTSGLRRIDLASGTVTSLDNVNVPQSDLGGVAIDDKYIYWNASGKILRSPKEGGRPATIASENVSVGVDLVVDNEKLYWANHSYYSPNNPTPPRPIYSVSKNGGEPEIFADQQHIPNSLVIDEKFLYWVTPSGIMKQAKSGGAPPVLFHASEKEGVDKLAEDATSLYFGFRGAGESRWALRRISKQGGASEIVVSTFTLGQIAIDDQNIYFFDEHDLMKDDLCRIQKTGGEIAKLDTGYSNGILVLSKPLIYFTAGDDLYSFAK